MPTTDTTKTSKRRAVTWGALAVFLLVAGTFALPALMGPSASQAEPLHSTDDEIARAIAEMDAIAEAAGSAMAQAGAEAAAQYNTSADEASRLAAQAAAESEGAVEGVVNATSSLESPPAGFDGNFSEAGQAPEFHVEPSSDSHVEYQMPADVLAWEDNNASVRAKLALGLPLTGNEDVDARLFALVDAYVSLKGSINSTGHDADNATGGSIIWSDDDFGTFTATGEGVSHQAAPDEQAAADAHAHGVATLEKAYAAASSTWSGVNATFALQIALEETVRAELEAIAEAQAEAEGEIEAQLKARQEATLKASAEARAEAHAEAERRVSLAQEAHVEARQRVKAESEAQVEAVYSKSAEAAEDLEAQAAAAIAQSADASSRIWAQANATLAVLADIEARTGTDMSAQARAVVEAAAAAEAKAQARAQATADVLLKQSASLRASADVRAKAILSAAAEAEARLDAKLAFAVDATLRAEAYTVARIEARAEATIVAHEEAAARAMFRAKAAAKGQAHIIVEAALKANAAATLSIDGSRDLMDIVRADTVADVERDVVIVRDVASDYESQQDINPQYERKASEYNAKADQLEADNQFTAGVTYLVQDDIDTNYWILLATQKDIEALGQKFL